MPLNEFEKERARYHLGWPTLTALAGVSLAVPGHDQLLSILDRNLNHLGPSAEPSLRRALQELDCIEDQISTARSGAAGGVTQVSGTALNFAGALATLSEQYELWVAKLSDITATPRNPHSAVAMMAGQGSGVFEPSC